jgi:branched-chain amino acid transport system substrate-binding protein
MHTAFKSLAVASLIACAFAAHAQKGETVRIAFIDPLSGPFANVGQNPPA